MLCTFKLYTKHSATNIPVRCTFKIYFRSSATNIPVRCTFDLNSKHSVANIPCSAPLNSTPNIQLQIFRCSAPFFSDTMSIIHILIFQCKYITVMMRSSRAAKYLWKQSLQPSFKVQSTEILFIFKRLSRINPGSSEYPITYGKNSNTKSNR